jgi:hypothetical protein
MAVRFSLTSFGWGRCGLFSHEQVRIAVGQRLGGIFQNFYSSYDWNAPPMEAKQKFQLSIRSVIANANWVSGMRQSC